MFTKSKFKIQVIETIIMTSDLTDLFYFSSAYFLSLWGNAVCCQKIRKMQTWKL